MYCPKCLHEQVYEGPCEQCDEPVLPDDVPNPYYRAGGAKMTGWLVLITLFTAVAVVYYLHMIGAF